MPRHVRKGDRVMVTSGFYKGQIGEVLRVIPDEDRVVVKGINLKTKHLRPTRTAPQGGIITREEPLHISKVSPVVDGKPTRVRFEIRPDGSKVRVAVRGGKELGVVRGPRAKAGTGR
jgi:large subunit ribosomal protein L24